MVKSASSLSAGQKKLASLNINLPPLPTTTIGSFPKTTELTEIRYKVHQGVLPLTELERKERIATDLWLREQTRLGLSVFVDGEMNRGDFVWFFASHIEGFEAGGTVRIWGNKFGKKPIIKRKLTWKKSITVEYWQLTQRATHNPVKAIVTGPYTLMDWSFNEYYSSREAALEDLISILRNEVTSLVEAGAKIIQIDEPALASRPDEFNLISDALKAVTKGLKCYFVLHHCYADLTDLWPKIEKLPFDNFAFEAANSNFKILNALKNHPTNKDLTLGVVDTQVLDIETPAQISSAIRNALKIIPRNQLWIAPDCGLKTLTTEGAIEKLDVMSKTAMKIRAGK